MCTASLKRTCCASALPTVSVSALSCTCALKNGTCSPVVIILTVFCKMLLQLKLSFYFFHVEVTRVPNLASVFLGDRLVKWACFFLLSAVTCSGEERKFG